MVRHWAFFNWNRRHNERWRAGYCRIVLKTSLFRYRLSVRVRSNQTWTKTIFLEDTAKNRSGIFIPLDGSETQEEIEARIIRSALERHSFNVTAAARTLGATRQTFRYRIEKYGIRADQRGEPNARG